MNGITKKAFDVYGDERGSLVALDGSNLPFEPKRVFYMYQTTSDVHRGNHAHKSCNEFLICTSGSCKVLLDDGKRKEEFVLDRPNEGLFIPCDCWREMYDFSSNAVLMAVADRLYDEKDYIRNYQEFLEYYHIKK